uniref:Uncharacterized protein n=1 Tax=Romanomermis culicivorax TaxID=13658 RepID=A0A915K1A9_ROMCU
MYYKKEQRTFKRELEARLEACFSYKMENLMGEPYWESRRAETQVNIHYLEAFYKKQTIVRAYYTSPYGALRYVWCRMAHKYSSYRCIKNFDIVKTAIRRHTVPYGVNYNSHSSGAVRHCTAPYGTCGETTFTNFRGNNITVSMPPKLWSTSLISVVFDKICLPVNIIIVPLTPVRLTNRFVVYLLDLGDVLY